MNFTTTTLPSSPVVGPQYYKSFGGYKIPFYPVGPLSFTETEGKKAYAIVYRDTLGRVIRFDKIELVWLRKEPWEVNLPISAEPEATIYFAVVRDANADAINIGEPLSYEDTENRSEFFAGHVGPSGKNGKVMGFRKDIAFFDIYEYWPNGRMRRRIKNPSHKPPSEEFFNRYGDPVAERILFAWEELYRSAEAALAAGDNDKAWVKFIEGLMCAKKEESVLGEVTALQHLSRFDALHGHFEDALDKCRIALAVWRVLNLPEGEMRSWCDYGFVEQTMGTRAAERNHQDFLPYFSAARHCYENARRLAQHHHNHQFELQALQALAQLDQEQQGLTASPQGETVSQPGAPPSTEPTPQVANPR